MTELDNQIATYAKELARAQQIVFKCDETPDKLAAQLTSFCPGDLIEYMEDNVARVGMVWCVSLATYSIWQNPKPGETWTEHATKSVQLTVIPIDAGVPHKNCASVYRKDVVRKIRTVDFT